jgi:pSer/pThr/pTyr-binding forkhead associated (FHA) protein
MVTSETQSTEPPAPLWVEGRFALVVHSPHGLPPQTVRILRPYALIGRVVGADVRIDDHRVSARHAYLHLDHRGLYAVDLATRTGTRVGLEGRGAGWLSAGDTMEIADHRVEVIDMQVGGGAFADSSDPLADARALPITRVTLFPSRNPDAPLVLGSELVFLGRSPSCGVHVEGASASRTHCVLIRTRNSAFVVDLAGRGTWLNDRPLHGAAPMIDGDSLMVGSARFEVRVEPPGRNRSGNGRSLATTRPAPPPATVANTLPSTPAELFTAAGLPSHLNLPAGLVPAEAQAAFLAWIMNLVQNTQSEMLRRQDEFHHDMVRLMGQMQRENTTLLNQHFERVEAINRELSSLRDEIGRRFGSEAPALPPATVPKPPITPRAAPIPIAPTPAPADPATATNWLLTRVKQLDQENRSSWRDLLFRLGSSKR